MAIETDLQVDVRKIDPDGFTLVGSVSAEVMELDEPNLRAKADLRYDLTVQEMDDGVLITGRAEADIDFKCVNCAEFFRKTIFEPALGALIEWPEDGSFVDLTGDIREAIILNFPAYPKCSETCSGLCDQCGHNLNKGPCDCAPPGDMRWQALENIKV